MLIELYRKQIWNDAKTVNVIGGGCLSKITKVLAVSLNFFCGKDVEPEEDKDSDSDVNGHLFNTPFIFLTSGLTICDGRTFRTTKRPNRKCSWVFEWAKRPRSVRSEQTAP